MEKHQLKLANRITGLIGIGLSIVSYILLFIATDLYFSRSLSDNIYYFIYAILIVLLILSIVLSYKFSHHNLKKEGKRETNISKKILVLFSSIDLIAVVIIEKDIANLFISHEILVEKDAIPALLISSGFLIVSGTIGLNKRKDFFGVASSLAIMFALMAVLVLLKYGM